MDVGCENGTLRQSKTKHVQVLQSFPEIHGGGISSRFLIMATTPSTESRFSIGNSDYLDCFSFSAYILSSLSLGFACNALCSDPNVSSEVSNRGVNSNLFAGVLILCYNSVTTPSTSSRESRHPTLPGYSPMPSSVSLTSFLSASSVRLAISLNSLTFLTFSACSYASS